MSLPRSAFNVRPLIASGAVLFVGMTVANVGSYALNLVVGRLLNPASFSIFVSLVSLAAILTMPATALSTVAAKFSSSFAADGRLSHVRSLFRFLDRVALAFGVGLCLVLLVASGVIGRYLHLPSVTPLFALIASFSVSFFLPSARGFLQGLQRFPALAVNMAIEPLVKIVGAVVFIRWSYGTSGAISSYGLAFIACYLLARWSLRQTLVGAVEPIDTRLVWRYSFPTLVTLSALSFLTSVDVILVRHYFGANDAGIYAGLATIGKIILYVSAPLVAVMFPLIATNVSRGERHVQLLVQTLGLMLVGSLVVLALFTIFPSQSVTLLFGVRYLAAAPYLAKYGFAMLLLSLVTVLTHYFLSIGFTRVSWLVAIGLGLEFAFVRFFHASLSQVIESLIGAFGSVLVLLAGTYAWLKRAQLAGLFR